MLISLQGLTVCLQASWNVNRSLSIYTSITIYKSVALGQLPSKWKRADITPFFTTGTKNLQKQLPLDFSNFNRVYIYHLATAITDIFASS